MTASSYIVHNSYGRIRMRHGGLQDPVLAANICASLEAVAGVDHAEVCTATGSLLVRYTPAVLSQEKCCELLQLVEKELPVVAQKSACRADMAKTAETGKPVGMKVAKVTGVANAGLQKAQALCTSRKVLNVGMLSTLAISLGGIFGNKTVHSLSGVLFVAATAVHIYRHRKAL